MAMAATCLAAVFLLGCNMTGMAQQPVQATIETVFTDIVAPAIQKSLAETASQNMAHQGSLEGIEPGYEVDGEGYWVVGVKIHATVRAIGVAGALSWNMQASDNPRPEAPVGPTLEALKEPPTVLPPGE
jgi:hypothetical protein